MKLNYLFLLLFSYLIQTKCNSNKQQLSLQIIKSSNNNLTPVTSSLVEEKAGANFSLLCDLVSSKRNRKYYDFQVSWIKQPSDLRFWREYDSVGNSSKKIISILQPSEMNKAVKHFQPLTAQDQGKYMCISLKFNLVESVEIVVRDEKPPKLPPLYQETISCGNQMFQCANGVCIFYHYICDGKVDCKDGSDESVYTCNGDPCKEKLQCYDGRCIPVSWCCDRHHDPNCTVTNRPKCCQVLSDSYEEEFVSPTVAQNHNGARYLFITICTLCILFVILLFLVLASRVVIMARKTDLSRTPTTQPRTVENITLTTTQPPLFNCDVYTYHSGTNRNENHINTEDCDVSDPLLFEEEQPPSYLDVIRAQNDVCPNLNEPPPPYTSREVLNQEA